MPALIGLAGIKQSGKDTLADALVRRGYVKTAFAAPLKSFCSDLFELTEAQVHGDKKDTQDFRYCKTPRQLLQIFGTDFVRKHISDDFWVDKFTTWYMSNRNSDVVVSDVRFPNEVSRIKDLGGKVYKVIRQGLTKQDMHVSEDVDSLTVDGVIFNDGSIDDLCAKAFDL